MQISTRYDCLICSRIRDIQHDKNRFFVREMKTGYVVLGDYQFYHGYTLFLFRDHVEELHALSPDMRTAFLHEMSVVGAAVFRAFRPQKLNYELLGNTHAHIHWHIFPRHESDPKPSKAIWEIDRTVRESMKTAPTDAQLSELKEKLDSALLAVSEKN